MTIQTQTTIALWAVVLAGFLAGIAIGMVGCGSSYSIPARPYNVPTLDGNTRCPSNVERESEYIPAPPLFNATLYKMMSPEQQDQYLDEIEQELARRRDESRDMMMLHMLDRLDQMEWDRMYDSTWP